VGDYIPAVRGYEFNMGDITGKVLGKVSEFVYANATAVIMGFSSVLINFVLVIFITFFLFVDGEAFLTEVKRLSPLDEKYDNEILGELKKTIVATFKGTLIIAVVQGILGSIGLLISGIGSWALWGVVMIFTSLIPFVGTGIVWAPAAVYLAITGHYIAAVFLAAWGVLVVGMADNLLRPYLLKGESNVHPLLIFFSIMGGIAYFGGFGIIIGPLVLSLLFYLLAIYKKYFNPQKEPPSPIK
jgi:predicted PurR-regulated permease PerM